MRISVLYCTSLTFPSFQLSLSTASCDLGSARGHVIALFGFEYGQVIPIYVLGTISNSVAHNLLLFLTLIFVYVHFFKIKFYHSGFVK